MCECALFNAWMILNYTFSSIVSLSLQVLLQLARDLFEDTTNLEVMMKKVMMESMELIPSERCSVMLIDQDKKEVCVSIYVHVSTTVILYSA